jgi:t-SNARE complex subunit (syntaxin)
MLLEMLRMAARKFSLTPFIIIIIIIIIIQLYIYKPQCPVLTLAADGRKLK